MRGEFDTCNPTTLQLEKYNVVWICFLFFCTILEYNFTQTKENMHYFLLNMMFHYFHTKVYYSKKDAKNSLDTTYQDFYRGVVA